MLMNKIGWLLGMPLKADKSAVGAINRPLQVSGDVIAIRDIPLDMLHLNMRKTCFV